jgi:hypothetical protein
VKRSRVTVNAAMLTTAVRVDAGAEADIRTVIVGNNAAGAVFEELSLRGGRLLRVLVWIWLEMKFLEPVWRVRASATAGERLLGHG